MLLGCREALTGLGELLWYIAASWRVDWVAPAVAGGERSHRTSLGSG